MAEEQLRKETGKRILKIKRELVDVLLQCGDSDNEYQKYRDLCKRKKQEVMQLPQVERQIFLEELARRTPIFEIYDPSIAHNRDTLPIPLLDNGPGFFALRPSSHYDQRVDRKDGVLVYYFCLFQFLPFAIEDKNTAKKYGLVDRPNDATMAFVPKEHTRIIGVTCGMKSDGAKILPRGEIEEKSVKARREGMDVSAYELFYKNSPGLFDDEMLAVLYSIDYDRYFDARGLNKLVGLGE